MDSASRSVGKLGRERRKPRLFGLFGASKTMSPLDTGSVTHSLQLVDPLGRLSPRADQHPTIGGHLRSVREELGLSLQELAERTRISRQYLAAIEDGDLSALPSRPFAIGYVRAYAIALALDGDTAAQRFKAETPDTSEPLQAPIGVQHDKPARSPFIFAAAAAVLVAVVVWNISQRALTSDDPPPPSLPADAPVQEATAPAGPIALGTALPPPADQTTPAPYLTPGLAAHAALPADGSAPVAVVQATAAIQPGPAPLAADFNPRGQVYGAPAQGPNVVLRARKSGTLVVRGKDGAVYFARQLRAGESYRAPLGAALTADVTEPAAFDLIVNGRPRGVLTSAQTALDKVSAEPSA